MSAAFAFIQFEIANLSIAPLLEYIGKDLNVPFANNLMTAFLFSGTLVLVWLGGAICDRFGVLTSAFLGILCATLPMTLMPWIGHSYTAVLYARIVEGLSTGFAVPAQGQILGRWFPRSQVGLAGGLMASSIAVGVAAGAMGGPAVFSITQNWQRMSALLSIFGWICLVFVVILAVVPKPRPPARPEEGTPASGAFRRALAAPVTWVGVLTLFAAAWCMQCLFNLTPTILSSHRPVGAGYSPVAAGGLMLGVTVSAIVGPVFVGLLLDKVFHGRTKPCLLIGFALMAVFIYSLVLPAVIYNPSVLLVSLVLAGLGIQFVFPTINVFISRAYVIQIVGKMAGLWMGLGTFGGVVGLYMGGVSVVRTGNYNLALTLMAVSGVVGFLLVFVLAKQKTAENPAAQAARVNEFESAP
jgi:MFS family permease